MLDASHLYLIFSTATYIEAIDEKQKYQLPFFRLTPKSLKVLYLSCLVKCRQVFSVGLYFCAIITAMTEEGGFPDAIKTA